MEKLTLRPATPGDRRKVFNWLANSNLTPEMLGPPKFPDNPAPTWDDFINDYTDHYFDGSQPLQGRSFIIEYNGQAIGHINYNPIDVTALSTELDIWLSDKKYMGKGFGTRALRLMCDYLEVNFNCKKFYIAPSQRNEAAIRSYTKAGFHVTNAYPANFQPDYHDTVLMVRETNR